MDIQEREQERCTAPRGVRFPLDGNSCLGEGDLNVRLVHARDGYVPRGRFPISAGNASQASASVANNRARTFPPMNGDAAASGRRSLSVAGAWIQCETARYVPKEIAAKFRTSPALSHRCRYGQPTSELQREENRGHPKASAYRQEILGSKPNARAATGIITYERAPRAIGSIIVFSRSHTSSDTSFLI